MSMVNVKSTPKEIEAHWTNFAKEKLVGRKIVDVMYLKGTEASDLMWDERPIILELDDGTVLFPLRDSEGNGPGTISGADAAGSNLRFPALPVRR